MLTAHSRILHGDQKRVLLRSGTQMANSKGEGVRGILDIFFLYSSSSLSPLSRSASAMPRRDTVHDRLSPRQPVHQRAKLFRVTTGLLRRLRETGIPNERSNDREAARPCNRFEENRSSPINMGEVEAVSQSNGDVSWILTFESEGRDARPNGGKKPLSVASETLSSSSSSRLDRANNRQWIGILRGKRERERERVEYRQHSSIGHSSTQERGPCSFLGRSCRAPRVPSSCIID